MAGFPFPRSPWFGPKPSPTALNKSTSAVSPCVPRGAHIPRPSSTGSPRPSMLCTPEVPTVTSRQMARWLHAAVCLGPHGTGRSTTVDLTFNCRRRFLFKTKLGRVGLRTPSDLANFPKVCVEKAEGQSGEAVAPRTDARGLGALGHPPPAGRGALSRGGGGGGGGPGQGQARCQWGRTQPSIYPGTLTGPPSPPTQETGRRLPHGPFRFS